MERENKTIEEYKREVFDVMNDDKRLKYMYEMNLEILEVSEILRNLTKSLEDKIKELYENLKTEYDEDNRLYILHKRDAYLEILERIKSGKYE